MEDGGKMEGGRKEWRGGRNVHEEGWKNGVR